LIDDAPHHGALQDEVGSGQVRRSGDKCNTAREAYGGLATTGGTPGG
jgi:hypothetical protein